MIKIRQYIDWVDEKFMVSIGGLDQGHLLFRPEALEVKSEATLITSSRDMLIKTFPKSANTKEFNSINECVDSSRLLGCLVNKSNSTRCPKSDVISESILAMQVEWLGLMHAAMIYYPGAE
mgnify:CR=1 FL=1|tara:strand:- start:322 stop:684 length:363 start_codon:yes stop_codon:yes gene_type:complete